MRGTMAKTATIRVAGLDDARQIAAVYAPIVHDTPISFEVTPPDAAEMRQRIADTTRRWPWLVAERDGGVTGYAYAAPHHTRAAYAWSADVSVYVAGDAQRAGHARALYTALLRLLTAQGYTSASAGIALPNGASVGLHEALGFVPIGVFRGVGYKLGQWWDVGWWQRRLPLPNDEPSPPLAWPDLSATVVTDALDAGATLLRSRG
jgi:L-amino acid N-acyltransferase YncA